MLLHQVMTFRCIHQSISCSCCKPLIQRLNKAVEIQYCRKFVKGGQERVHACNRSCRLQLLDSRCGAAKVKIVVSQQSVMGRLLPCSKPRVTRQRCHQLPFYLLLPLHELLVDLLLRLYITGCRAVLRLHARRAPHLTCSWNRKILHMCHRACLGSVASGPRDDGDSWNVRDGRRAGLACNESIRSLRIVI